MTIYVVHYAIYYVVHYVLCSTLEKTLMPGKIGGKRRRGQKRVKWLDGITDTTDMNLRKLQKIVKNREAWILQCMGLQSQTWTTNVMHLLNIVYQLSLQKAFLPWNYYNLLILSILKIVLFICVSNSYNFYILKDTVHFWSCPRWRKTTSVWDRDQQGSVKCLSHFKTKY